MHGLNYPTTMPNTTKNSTWKIRNRLNLSSEINKINASWLENGMKIILEENYQPYKYKNTSGIILAQNNSLEIRGLLAKSIRHSRAKFK